VKVLRHRKSLARRIATAHPGHRNPPIADSYLLLEHGSPKTARIYPEGGHMGAMRGVNPDIMASMIIDWMKERLAH
jgi:hypothetical protein